MTSLPSPIQALGSVSAGTPQHVEIRPLQSQNDFQACLAMQRLTWGENFSECVPPTILNVVQRVGGVAAGAFDERGALLGFVFGFTGIRNCRLVHWSDMLAVREEAQGMGIGRRLKQFQRTALLTEGVEVIYWTYEPLVARNAHFNLNRLGARVIEYVPDMYGEHTASKLHDGIGTDRFIVAWEIAALAESGPERIPMDPAILAGPVVNQRGDGSSGGAPAGAPVVRIEIPSSLHRVTTQAPAGARRWREETREAFLYWMARGYAVRGFHQEADTDRCFYILMPQPDQPDL